MFTQGNWKVGKNMGCVVTDETPTDKDVQTGHGEVEYYGGLLICESVRTPDDATLIAAAPEMLRALQAVLNLGEFHETGQIGSILINAINKATK